MFYRFGFRTNAHILMYSLALSDLLCSILMPFSVTVDVLRHSRHLGKLWIQICLIKEVINYVGGMTNMLNYFLVTIDRYILINHPLKYKIIFTKKRLKFAVFWIWVLASILDAMAFVFMSNEKDVEKYGCYQSHVLSVNGYYSIVVGALTCTIVILVFYIIIILKLNARDKEQHAMGVNSQMVASKVTKALAMVVGIYLGLMYQPSLLGFQQFLSRKNLCILCMMCLICASI